MGALDVESRPRGKPIREGQVTYHPNLADADDLWRI